VIPALLVTQRQFDLLAAGSADPGTIKVLLAGQYSKNVLLIQAVLDTARRVSRADGYPLREAYSLLSAVQQARPDVVSAVLGHPHVSLWAAACLRSTGRAAGDRYGYLACVAVSAALQADADFEIALKVRGSALTLPGLGTMTLRTASGAEIILLRGGGGAATVTASGQSPLSLGAGASGSGWQPFSQLRGGLGVVAQDDSAASPEISVLLDDRDPYRAPQWLNGDSLLQPAPPLQPREIVRWQELFGQAWRVLVGRHGHHAAAMATGLRTLVPMSARTGDQGNSGTALDAFGTVLLTEPANHLSLALTLMHEFQHAKLAALAHLVSLYHADAEPRFYAPWRDDPRPLGALLQGAYAHLAVAEFWREQSQLASGQQSRIARLRFVACQDDVRLAIDQLGGSGLLTGMGERFIAGMAATLDGWRSDADRGRPGIHPGPVCARGPG
jgi:HEXXH motif-containing protein